MPTREILNPRNLSRIRYTNNGWFYNTWLCYIILFLFSACPSPPHSSRPVPDGREGVQSRSHVQVDGDVIIWRWFAAIIIYDVPDVTATPIHHPVVTIKR